MESLNFFFQSLGSFSNLLVPDMMRELRKRNYYLTFLPYRLIYSFYRCLLAVEKTLDRLSHCILGGALLNQLFHGILAEFSRLGLLNNGSRTDLCGHMGWPMDGIL